MNSIANLEQTILENLRQLPPEKQQEVLDFTEFLRQKTASNQPRLSIKGLCSDLNLQITEADIAEARQEMWGNFPRSFQVMAVAIDTHIIVWYILEPQRLSEAASTTLEQTENAGELIYLSAISIVELCYLIERGRLPAIVLERLLEALNQPNNGITIVPLDQAISLAVQHIDRATVPEMPDRIIAATALYLNCPLVTRDRRIQAFSGITTIW